MMRLLGVCPTCMEDGLVVRDDEVVCDACPTIYAGEDPAELSRAFGLIQVEVRIEDYKVELFCVGAEQIPNYNVVGDVVGAAVAEKFDLQKSGVMRGGLRGEFFTKSFGEPTHEPIDLAGVGTIGLEDTYQFSVGAEPHGCQIILQWYGRLLEALFLGLGKPASEDHRPRGAILRLDRTDPELDERVKLLLYLALREVGESEDFAKKVLSRAGFTDKDIAEILAFAAVA